ncbi:MAG: prephenate dehydrogenase [Pelotomaculum sp. PtaU1.Bin035]|nr:MAG: prephenate dehydrogenase [Pelotomaculum sp. PtaU1.Bin035]
MNPEFNRVAIIGVGLIGGSLGMALCARGLAREVVGSGSRVENLRLAAELGAIHRFAGSVAEGVAGAELVIIATPVSATILVLKEILPYLSPGSVVTDVGSTKASIVSAAGELLPPGISFAGGHPMAGSERAGVREADQYLFENAFYIVTPTPETPPAAVDTVSKLADGVGARLIKMEPEQHDLAVAAVSHLPYIIAASLVNTVARIPESEKILPLAAGGFRDTTRIASSSTVMWRDILRANREQVLSMIRCFRLELDVFESVIAAGENEAIQKNLESAREVRSLLPAKASRFHSNLYEIVVTVPDQPGVIASFAAHLANAGINICDIEIMRVREGEGGTIRVGFTTYKEQDEAIRTLKNKGYTVRKR